MPGTYAKNFQKYVWNDYDQLTSNENTVNFENENFMCKNCSYVTSEYSKFHKHTKHCTKDEYECPVCQKTFSKEIDGRSWDIIQKISLHSGKLKVQKNNLPSEKEAIYCEVCPFTCNNAHDYCNHEFKHMAKMIECHICQKKFSSKTHLSDHLTVHTGELLYNCKVCLKMFRYRMQLSRHRQMYNH